MDKNNLKSFNREFLTSTLEKRDGLVFNLDSKDLIQKIPDDFVQMIYFDPPFSGKNKNDIPHRQDRESGDLAKYLWSIDKKKSFKEECKFFIKEFHRILTSNGSIFVHLPWDLAYDIKPIMDQIFEEEECFRNEIIWTFRRWEVGPKALQENHHTILWYTKDPKNYVFNRLQMPRAESTKKRFGTDKILSAVDKKTGKRIPSVTNGESDSTMLNDTWVWDDYKGTWLYELNQIDEKKYIDSIRKNFGISHTAPIKKLKSLNDNETYPFEKPAALIERLVKMSTNNENDIVLDFFAGTGVVAEVCKNEKRKYLLNEISHYTTLDIIKRLQYDILVPGLPLYNHFSTYGKDLELIDGKEFEFWAGYTLNGISDDSFRGRDTYHGLDIFIQNDIKEFYPGEVKKKLTSRDEWYKIKSKTEKFFELEKFKNLPRVFYIVTTEVSNSIEYEIINSREIKYVIIQLEDKKYSHLLRSIEIEKVIKAEVLNVGMSKIEAEIERSAILKKKAAKRS